uniref:Uncharacterized protein n=1 Tax=Echinococcus granulosus TaxID=6210 RepID=A0A068WPC9_ECHGR|nr:hypothetical protein EgrG_002023900 [Echinococcus granulosus]
MGDSPVEIRPTSSEVEGRQADHSGSAELCMSTPPFRQTHHGNGHLDTKQENAPHQCSDSQAIVKSRQAHILWVVYSYGDSHIDGGCLCLMRLFYPPIHCGISTTIEGKCKNHWSDDSTAASAVNPEVSELRLPVVGVYTSMWTESWVGEMDLSRICLLELKDEIEIDLEAAMPAC